MELNERRGYPRVIAGARIRVRNLTASLETEPVSGGREYLSATLIDLSASGAKFEVAEPLGAVGDVAEVVLPLYEGEEIFAVARILRVEPCLEGQWVAVQFLSLTPEHRRRLDHLLMMLLSGPGGGRRRHARLAQRLEVHYGDAAELIATLENISKGGLKITVPEPFEPDQPVQLVISPLSGDKSVTLEARVVYQKPATLAGKDVFHVGLKFDHLGPELEEQVTALLDSLLGRSRRRRKNTRARR